MLVFHWSRLTPTLCLFFLCHGLHQCITCFSLVTSYIHTVLVFHGFGHGSHAVLVFHWSRLTPTHSLFPVIILLILSTAGCICQQHPPGSTQVKVIYYIMIPPCIPSWRRQVTNYIWQCLRPSSLQNSYLRWVFKKSFIHCFYLTTLSYYGKEILLPGPILLAYGNFLKSVFFSHSLLLRRSLLQV